MALRRTTPVGDWRPGPEPGRPSVRRGRRPEPADPWPAERARLRRAPAEPSARRRLARDWSDDPEWRRGPEPRRTRVYDRPDPREDWSLGRVGRPRAPRSRARGPVDRWTDDPGWRPRRAARPRGRPVGWSGPRRRRRPVRLVLGVLAVLLLALAGFAGYLDTTLNREPVLADYDGRPSEGAGTNWLMVGSDSRQGLTGDQKQELATGDAGGGRTDTMMLLHIPGAGGGPATLVSLPRDSLVAIPGRGRNKLNAAYALGGPQLLTRTVEQATGLRIDHYAEVGFGGFAGVVDAAGGVNICVPQRLRDPAAGLNLQPGCQNLDGAQALGFVRTRHLFARQDLDRIQNQRQFVSALLGKVTSGSVLANPMRLLSVATNGARALTVADGDHLTNLAGAGLALAGSDTATTTVPIGATPTLPGVGSVVVWDRTRASELFQAFRGDVAVPDGVLSR
jgi:LCP family protein required for cell wall assembly